MKWVLYSPEDARKILRAKKNGDSNITLGSVKSAKYPSGKLYAIDLVSMKQTNVNTSFSRDIKIINPGPFDDQVEGQAEEVIFDHLHAIAFQYSPLGRTILGLAKNIKTITKAHLQQYISTHYTGPRMVVSAAGAVKHEEIVELSKKLFTNLSTDTVTTAQLIEKEPAIFTGSEVRMIDDDIPLAQFVVAFNSASWTDPDSVALMVMQTMLGSWNKSAGGGKNMGSELAQRVGINELPESIMAFNTNYKDAGLFGVYAIAKIIFSA